MPKRRPTSSSGATGAAGTRGKRQLPPPSRFLPEVLDRTVIAIPLLKWFQDPERKGELFAVVIDLNLNFPMGVTAARRVVESQIDALKRARRPATVAKGSRAATVTKGSRPATVAKGKSGRKHRPASSDGDLGNEDLQYVFATLYAEQIRELARRDSEQDVPAIHHIWPDFQLKTLINKSISAVKADAAHASFAASGVGIVWAVIDSGIDGTHPHFTMHKNLELAPPLEHRDFTGRGAALEDAKGHGTHVAGIIAGEFRAERLGPGQPAREILATTRHRNPDGDPTQAELKPAPKSMCGMAPECKLLSLKVLDSGDDSDVGTVKGVIGALQYIQRLNGHGRRLLVHGVNLSVGYDFEPEWFACGQSPLCVEVDRLVKSGVVVVVAAGNSGFGVVTSEGGPSSAGLPMTINDPGNAALAITVGSTHRDMPHTYGVSYFSSKGPTGDGRSKPDLVAPGEKVISCESSHAPEAKQRRAKTSARTIVARYAEGSGTSQAAPHVSGVIAAFLSIRREFLSHPEEVKRIFLSSATDLHRERYFQGHGLVDLMRAIQSV